MAASIAIVGGGPAGTSVALNLIQQGVDPGDLVILDRARFPRPKLCGGALTYRGTQALAAVLQSHPAGYETRSIAFRSAAGSIEIFEPGAQWVYDRARLDHALLEACRERGVEIREQTPVVSIEPGIDDWRVGGKGWKESFRWVIGADGAAGLSRRASGLRGGRIGRLVEAVFEQVDSPHDPGQLHFDFDPILHGIPGYAWAFPYPSADGTLLWKLGVMDGRGRTSGQDLRRFTLRYAERNGFRPLEKKVAGFPERYYDWQTRGHRPGLLLVGEAYGIDALLGEGIAPALYHAAYAATRLRQALDGGDAKIGGYERGFAKTPEGRNLWFQARLADRIYGRWGERWLKLLFELPKLRALAQTGQESYGRLRRHSPALIASGLYYLLSRGLPRARLPSGAVNEHGAR